MKKSTNACSSSSQKSSIFSSTSRNLVTNTRISLQSVSSKDSNLSIATFKIKSKRVKKTSIQQVACVRIYKHCKQNFNFNNKLHDHICEHHARKSVKNFDFRVFAFEFAYKFVKKSTVTCSLTSQFASFTLFATSRNQIFESETFFKTITSSKRSSLTLATNKNISKSMKKLSINCSLTSLFSSSQTSVRNLHEFHLQKSHLIMNDFSRMFVEKSSSFDLQRHQNRRFFSQSFDFRQFSRSCFSISTKSYLTIENLFEMFDEEIRRNSLFQTQKNVSSREFFSKQSRITIYFKSTINQKSFISQNSKSSKSKSLNQHMFAKSIRIAFSKDLFEKSINLSYKMFNVFDLDSKSSIETSFFIFVFLRLFSIFLLALAFVSTISAARMNCLNVCEKVISIIDRVNIEFVASKRSWEETKSNLLEYLVTKHQKFEFSTLYTQNYISNLEEASSQLFVCFIIYCILHCDILQIRFLVKTLTSFASYIQNRFKACRNYIVSCINLQTSSKSRYLYLYQRSEESKSLRVFRFCFEIFDFEYLEMTYHIIYLQISLFMS